MDRFWAFFCSNILMTYKLQPGLSGAQSENSLGKKWLFGIAGTEDGKAAIKMNRLLYTKSNSGKPTDHKKNPQQCRLSYFKIGKRYSS